MNHFSSFTNKFHRMTSLRHNPYVGSFHGKSLQMEDTANLVKDMMSESKRNPLVGSFRHSPSGAHSLGLKRILYQNEETKPSIISQLQVPRESRNVPMKRSFLQSLKKIPLKVFSSSVTRSSASVASEAEIDAPVCSICLEIYVDGDELSTLACSHCFHKECARKWFFQGCLNKSGMSGTFNCPECRQDHEQLSQQGTSTDCGGSEEISSTSFFQVGESLAFGAGYDFMSDFGSDTARTVVSAKQLLSPKPCENRSSQESENTTVAMVSLTRSETSPSVRSKKTALCESCYSDCGVPL